MITPGMVDLASETLGSPVDPAWLDEAVSFYRPLSLENLQRLLWEELNNLVKSDYRDDGAAETASAIRAVMAIRRAG
jgi:hypothetical protein